MNANYSVWLTGPLPVHASAAFAKIYLGRAVLTLCFSSSPLLVATGCLLLARGSASAQGSATAFHSASAPGSTRLADGG